jgi:hypothetical protein
LKQTGYSSFLIIVAFGSAWGIFEAVIGYFLHILAFNFGWLIWYPVSCFFMACVYRKTHKVSSVLLVGVLCSSIKLLNLFLPGRVDKVINPAMSIVFEAMAMAITIYVLKQYYHKDQKTSLIKALASIGMNTAWRLLFILYLIILVPNWMRELSVISSADKFIPFFVIQNLITSIVLFFGYLFQNVIFWPFEALEHKIISIQMKIPNRQVSATKTAAVMVLLCLNIFLQVSL